MLQLDAEEVRNIQILCIIVFFSLRCRCLPSPRRLCISVRSITGPGLVLMLQLLHLRLQFGGQSEGNDTHMVTRLQIMRRHVTNDY